MGETKVYVGGLPSDATSGELEDVFSRYGRLRKVWVARRPPGFAFIEFDDDRDAEDAVRALDGTRICGVRARVEVSTGRRRGGGFRSSDLFLLSSDISGASQPSQPSHLFPLFPSLPT